MKIKIAIIFSIISLILLIVTATVNYLFSYAFIINVVDLLQPLETITNVLIIFIALFGIYLLYSEFNNKDIIKRYWLFLAITLFLLIIPGSAIFFYSFFYTTYETLFIIFVEGLLIVIIAPLILYKIISYKKYKNSLPLHFFTLFAVILSLVLLPKKNMVIVSPF